MISDDNNKIDGRQRSAAPPLVRMSSLIQKFQSIGTNGQSEFQEIKVLFNAGQVWNQSMVMISRRSQLKQSEVLSFDSSQECINSVQYYYAIKKLLEYITCPNFCSW